MSLCACICMYFLFALSNKWISNCGSRWKQLEKHRSTLCCWLTETMAWQVRSIDSSRTDSLKQEDGLDIWLAKRSPWLRTEDTYRQNPWNNRSSRLPVCSRIPSACQWSLGGLIGLDLLCMWGYVMRLGQGTVGQMDTCVFYAGTCNVWCEAF